MGKSDVLESRNKSPKHRPDEEGGCEHSSGSAADKGYNRSENLQADKRSQHLPGELVVNRLIYEVVTGAHNLWCAQNSDGSNHQSGDGRLKILGPAGHAL